MQTETKNLLKEKLHAVPKGYASKNVNGQWIHARDLKSLIDCENEELKKLAQSRLEKLSELRQFVTWLTDHMDSDELREKSTEEYGLGFEECISMVYDEILDNTNQLRKL